MQAARRCGGCGEEIPVRAAACVYEIGHAVCVRCETCEGTPAPPGLPELPVLNTTPRPLPLVRFGPAMLPLDWKQEAAHDREPGEEG